MTDHPYGWLSLLPPLVAIGLAMTTRRILLSLLTGIFVGALILAAGNPIAAVSSTVTQHLWPKLTNPDTLHIFAFTLLMGAMVGIIRDNGGMRGLVQAVSRWASNRRRGQLTTWALGLFIFFDDYANTILLGNTLRPLSDRLKISREKLAYLVDSTAAPVAGLALVSTWVAVEIGYVSDGLATTEGGQAWSSYELFVESIPYRFYVVLALVMIPVLAWLGRDFGPMLQAERTRIAGEHPALSDEQQVESRARWFNALIPIGVTVASIMWFLYATGRESLGDGANEAGLRDILGEADAYGSLLWGALAGVITATGLSLLQRLLDQRQLTRAARSGAEIMVPALAILWLASTMSAMTGNRPSAADEEQAQLASAVLQSQENLRAALLAAGVDTGMLASVIPASDSAVESDAYPYRGYRLYLGDFLSGKLSGDVPVWLLPTMVFILSAFVAFSTGTSFGTMGIIMPLAINVVYGVLAVQSDGVSASDPILLASIGSVLAGAIFGDHCSPISDTTVLSSQASGCNHMAHVWTQLPYALVVGGISIVFGTLPVGLGVPAWLCLILGFTAIVLTVRFVGKKVVE